MRTMLCTSAVAVWVCLSPAVTLAADLNWSQTTGLLFYDTAGNWTPNKTPLITDNVTFSILITDPQIIIGAASRANNVNVIDNDWTFTGAGGAALVTGGVVTIDDPLGTTTVNGTNLTVGSAVNWDNAGNLLVGNIGAGGLRVEGNADLRAYDALIGSQAGSEGAVTVDGVGSTLTADGVGAGHGIFVGHTGVGTLNVTGGGFVQTLDTSADISVGFSANGEGTLNITGTGSRVRSEDFLVGQNGTGHLTVAAGGVMDCNIGASADAWVGSAVGASGDVTVTGNSSVWNAREIRIGAGGIGTLDIEAGGKTDAVGQVIIGELATGSGTVTVTGSGAADSLLEVGGRLTVGALGQGRLHVENGANVTVAENLFVGTVLAQAYQHQVTVTGAGSTVTVSGYLEVGQYGKGNLQVLDGARVSAGNWTSIGRYGGSEGVATIDGMDSFLSSAIAISVGAVGTGYLNVTGGGLVQSPLLYVGPGDGSAGMVYVSGSDGTTPSTLAVSGTTFVVGGLNTNNNGIGVMTIAYGGQVLSNGMIIGWGNGGASDGTGTVYVNGSGSLLNTRYYGAAAITYIGAEGSGELGVEPGGQVQAAIIRMGTEAGTENSRMFIFEGSTVDVTGEITVGWNRAAEIGIQDGGQLISGTNDTSNATIGLNSTANGAYVTVFGGSVWNHQGSAAANHAIVVGSAGGNPVSGEWSKLNVFGGGKVLAHDLRVGDAAGGAGWVTVDGKDGLNIPSTVSANGTVVIGDDASGRLTVSGGGLFEETGYGEELRVGGATGTGTVLVTGTGSRLRVNTSFLVGNSARGALNVEDGGTVTNGGHAWIAARNGSTGLVTVGDNGANPCTWNIGANLSIGGWIWTPATGAGTLTINPSGQVDVGVQLTMWGNTGGGSSTLNLAGGTLSVGSTDIRSGFNFISGTFRYRNNATLDADTLNDLLGATPTLVADQELDVLGTATLSAPLRLNGGTFGVGSISVADMSNLEFDAGTFNLTGDNLTVGTGGLLGADPTITAVQTVNVTHNVTIDIGSQFTVVGGFSSGGATNNGDLILIDPTNGGKTIAGDLDTPAGSTVTLVGDITFTGAVSGAGGFYGPGTAHFAGGYSPGDSPAQVPFEGSVALAATNALAIEIGGTAPGSGYDQVNVAGAAELAGELTVSFWNGFVPLTGQSFEVLTAASRTGQFDGPEAWHYTPAKALVREYEPGGLTLLATWNGDATCDGAVDVSDLSILAGNYRQTGKAWANGDFNGDGAVDVSDLSVLAGNYRKTAEAGGTPIPEPATLALLALGALAATRRRWRKP